MRKQLLLNKSGNLYNLARIAWEIERTAMGDGFFGNALRVAKDCPTVTAEERTILDLLATGADITLAQRTALCDLALRLDALPTITDTEYARKSTKREASGEYQVRMESDEYGEEVFNYDTAKEARAGYARLQDRIAKLQDGVERRMELVLVLTMDTMRSDDTYHEED